MDRSFFVLAAIVSIGSVLGWTGALIWSAIQDGREQRRINASVPKDTTRPTDTTRRTLCVSRGVRSAMTTCEV